MLTLGPPAQPFAREGIDVTHAYLLAGCRTPIGKFQGGLATLPAPKLGAIAIAEALRRSGLLGDDVEEVIMGNVLVGRRGPGAGSAGGARQPVCPPRWRH